MLTEADLNDLYRRYAPSVHRRALRIMGADADACEVVQEIFLSLLERPEQFAGLSSLTTFLYRMTTNACLTRLRNERNRVRLKQERFGNSKEPLAPDMEEALQVRRAVEAMPEKQAQAAVYYLVDGMTHQEIAELLGCSRRHVGDLLAKVHGCELRREKVS